MENIVPEAAEVTQFWSNILSIPVTQRESVWLEQVTNDLSNVEKQDGVHISSPDLQKQLTHTASWKSPGPDGIHGFWLKHFSSLHKFLCTQFNNSLATKSIPEWMTTGRTVLLMKEPAKRNDVGNYRSIACLNII